MKTMIPFFRAKSGNAYAVTVDKELVVPAGAWLRLSKIKAENSLEEGPDLVLTIEDEPSQIKGPPGRFELPVEIDEEIHFREENAI